MFLTKSSFRNDTGNDKTSGSSERDSPDGNVTVEDADAVRGVEPYIQKLRRLVGMKDDRGISVKGEEIAWSLGCVFGFQRQKTNKKVRCDVK